jgi:hypothetical protein
MGASASGHEPRSRAIAGLARWNATDRSDLHSRNDAYALQRHGSPGIPPSQRGVRRRRRFRRYVLFASQRLRRLPPADRRSFGCPLAIKCSITQYPPNTRGFPGHVNGKCRSSSWQPNVGLLRRVRRQPAGRRNRVAVVWCRDGAGPSSLHARNASGCSRRRLGNGGSAGVRCRIPLTTRRNRRSMYILAGPCGRSAGNLLLSPPLPCRPGICSRLLKP